MNGLLIKIIACLSIISGSISLGASAPPENAAPAVSVEAYGAKGDGITDDTAAIQSALDKNPSVFIPDGEYLINVDTALYPQSNQTITLSKGATLKAKVSHSGSTGIFRIYAVHNVSISGGTLYGERAGHTGTDGEWGMGIIIGNGASSITVSDMEIKNFWGDGVIVGNGNATVSAITVRNVICDNNRRQGLTLLNADNVLIKDSVFKNSNGVEPNAGIDIEPESGQTASNITLIGVECLNNAGGGLEICGCYGVVKNITLRDCSFHDNDKAGLRAHGVTALVCENTEMYNNANSILIQGNLKDAEFSNVQVYNNQDSGVILIGGGTKGIADITFKNSSFYNNGQSGKNKHDGVFIYSEMIAASIRNISFLSCAFFDNQTSPTQRDGLHVSRFPYVSDITFDDSCSFGGNIRSSYYYS